MHRRRFLSRAGAGLGLALLPSTALLPLASAPGDRSSRPPRPGLSRCRDCGEWKGETRDADGLVRSVRCRCEPSVCSRCGDVVHPRQIGSHYWDRGRQAVVHVPTFVGMKHSCAA